MPSYESPPVDAGCELANTRTIAPFVPDVSRNQVRTKLDPSLTYFPEVDVFVRLGTRSKP